MLKSPKRKTINCESVSHASLTELITQATVNWSAVGFRVYLAVPFGTFRNNGGPSVKFWRNYCCILFTVADSTDSMDHRGFSDTAIIIV